MSAGPASGLASELGANVEPQAAAGSSCAGSSSSAKRQTVSIANLSTVDRTTSSVETRLECGHQPTGAAPSKVARRATSKCKRETGVASKRVKLLKHPIEHLQRNLLLSWLFAVSFKLLALLTGPPLATLLGLLLVPGLLLRAALCWALNCAACGARRPASHLALTSLEAYWFRPTLVNQAILVLRNNKQQAFRIETLRTLVAKQVLSLPKYSKFSACVVAVRFPLFKNLFWKLKERHQQQQNDNNSANQQTTNNDSDTHSDQAWLAKHIFVDTSFGARAPSDTPADFRASLRRHLFALSQLALDMDRPLWELRAIEQVQERKVHLIFRCHQSLADGSSLGSILTECLAGKPLEDQGQSRADNKTTTPAACEPDCDGFTLIDAREPFVCRVSRLNCLLSAIIVGPLTVLLWLVWSFTRRRQSHLRRASRQSLIRAAGEQARAGSELAPKSPERLYLGAYNLTKFSQIKQMTRSKVGDVLLCALTGALRNYLRHFNGLANPPDLNAALVVDTSAARRHQASKQSENNGDGKCRVDNDDDYEEDSADERARCAKLARPAKPSQVQLALVRVPLPLRTEGLVPRLWRVRETMDELRHSADLWVMLALQQVLFSVLPTACYQTLLDKLALQNSSLLISNVRGPQNLVRSWCANLFQRAMLDAQQAATCVVNLDKPLEEAKIVGGRQDRTKAAAASSKRHRLELRHSLGSISAIYNTLTPPSKSIPITFNCLSYHKKLFVGVISRSVLIEDAKLLTQLFFEQLDSLAEGVGKRRSFVAIVSAPKPTIAQDLALGPSAALNHHQAVGLSDDHDDDGEVEQAAAAAPAAELIRPELEAPAPHAAGSANLLDYSDNEADDAELVEQHYRSQTVREAKSALELMLNREERRKFRDDIEARIGIDGRTSRCETCRQPVCTCRRRKSLFSPEAVGRSPLLGNSWLSMSRQRASDFIRVDELAEEELDLEAAAAAARSDPMCRCERQAGTIQGLVRSASGCSSSVGDKKQASDNNNPGSGHQFSSGKLNSLGYCQTCNKRCATSPSRSSRGGRLNCSTQSVASRSKTMATVQVAGNRANFHLDVPRGRRQDRRLGGFTSDGCLVKRNSKSESELLTTNYKHQRRHDERQLASAICTDRTTSRHSWFSRVTRKSHSQHPNQRKASPNSANVSNSNLSIQSVCSADGQTSKLDTTQQVSLTAAATRTPSADKRRRQSVATLMGLSGSLADNFQRPGHKVIVLNDHEPQINYDAAATTTTKASGGGKRSRRASLTGAVTGTQRRRASLMVPFGLSLNQGFPKPPTFMDDDDDDDDDVVVDGAQNDCNNHGNNSCGEPST